MADYTYIDSTGVIVPDTSDTLGTVQNEYVDVFGAELNLDPATPQGRLIDSEVTARQSFIRNNATVANQINPNLAGGVFLDAIWSLTGGERVGQSRTVIPGVLLAGVPTTLIPGGSQARTANGTVCESLGDMTLDGSGNGSVDFRAIEYGPVAVAIGTLTTPVTGVLGWESVTNPVAGVPGVETESDVASRLRRRQTLALQGVALPEAIISGVMDVEGVNSLAFRENTTNATTVIDGISLIEHSIWLCVDGGSNLDVAAAILAKKSLGCDYNGPVTVNVTDAASGQVYPVKFQRPTLVPVKARVTARAINTVADPATTIRAALVAYAAGEIDGEQGFVVGASVSPFELAGAVNAYAPGIYVQKLEVAKLADAFGVVEIPLLLSELATLNTGDITVILV